MKLRYLKNIVTLFYLKRFDKRKIKYYFYAYFKNMKKYKITYCLTSCMSNTTTTPTGMPGG